MRTRRHVEPTGLGLDRTDSIEIEMFELDDRGIPLDPPPPVRHRTIVETLDVWRAALDAVQANARYVNTPGGFVTPPVDFPTHSGFREDIRVTLHADARAATDVALAAGFFDDDIRGLRIDESSIRTHKTELSWDATLRTAPWRRRRAATLRLSPSPSFHVTVVRLTPVRRQRMATRAFIRAGLRATQELTGRLDSVLSARRVNRRSCRRSPASTTR